MAKGLPLSPDGSGPRLFDAMIGVLRTGNYSRNTSKAYVGWVRRFLTFHGGVHPLDLCEADVAAFLTYLTVETNVAPATQNQALAALVFLYKRVLGRPLAMVDGVVWAKRDVTAVDVLSPAEVALVLDHMNGTPKLVCSLLYGSGLRLLEALELRVKDVSFERCEIVVRQTKGHRDRRTMLPLELHEPLRAHLLIVKEQHDSDLRFGRGRVPMPFALDRKYPNADREWAWQRVFPASRHYIDRETGVEYRHHVHETVIQKAVKEAAAAAGVHKSVHPHVFRHSFATHVLEAGYNIRTVQQLLGHADVTTTMRYLHVMNKGSVGVKSPFDALKDARSYADREGLIRKDPDA